MRLDIRGQSRVSVSRLRRVEKSTFHKLARGDPKNMVKVEDGLQGVVGKEIMLMVMIRDTMIFPVCETRVNHVARGIAPPPRSAAITPTGSCLHFSVPTLTSGLRRFTRLALSRCHFASIVSAIVGFITPPS